MDDSGQIIYKVLSGTDVAENRTDTSNNEKDEPDLSWLCRICGNTNEYLIPIFEGEGQENNLAEKIHSYLPIKVNALDNYPDHVCYQCASTLLAFHDLVDCCVQANDTLTSRIQRGHTKKKKKPDQARTSANQERYSLSFRSFHQAQRCLTSPRVCAAGIKTEPDTNQIRYTEPYSAINGSRTPYIFLNSTIENERRQRGQDEKESDMEYVQKQYLRLRDVILKLKQHIMNNHNGGPNNWINYYSDDEEDYEPLSKLVVDLKNKSVVEETTVEGNSRYPCTRCIYVTNSKEDLKSHTQNAHNSHSLFKRSSRRIYDAQTREELEKVKVKINGKIHFKCTICDQLLTSAYSYVTHKTIHSGQKLFQCQICGRKFRLLGFLKNHMKHIHSLKSKQDLYEYQNSHANSEADSIEGRKYLDYNAIEKVKVIINGVVFYECEICHKKLTRVNYYLSHMSIHTGEKKFICHLCGKSFRLSTMLQIHLRLTHERIKNYPCDICHQKFGTSTNLVEHRRTHTGERPHVCPLCGKSFKQKSALFVHNRSHTDHFPYRCGHCDAKFRIQSQLKYHMVRHTGETPHVCEICGRAFAILSQLNRHKKNHVEGRPFPCTHCDKAFRHKKNLKTHLKNCHKIE